MTFHSADSSDLRAKTGGDVTSQRTDWIDATKGLMIILVVFGHTWRGVFKAGLLPEAVFHAVDSRIYAFHMPVFFALAGWFFLSSLEKKSMSQFVLSRLQRLLWPMILWTYIFFGFKLLAGQYANTPVSSIAVLTSPIPGKAHLWFLWALLVMSLFFVWMKPLLKREGSTDLALFAALLSIIAMDMVRWPPGTLEWLGAPLNYVVFFFVGMGLSRFMWRDKTPVPILIVSITCFCAIQIYWPDVAASAWAKSGSLALTICTLIAMSAAGSALTPGLMRFLCRLGAGSMAIYLAHTIFAAGLRELLLQLGMDNATFQVVSGTLIGLSAPLVLLWAARKTGTEKILGF